MAKKRLESIRLCSSKELEAIVAGRGNDVNFHYLVDDIDSTKKSTNSKKRYEDQIEIVRLQT